MFNMSLNRLICLFAQDTIIVDTQNLLIIKNEKILFLTVITGLYGDYSPASAGD